MRVPYLILTTGSILMCAYGGSLFPPYTMLVLDVHYCPKDQRREDSLGLARFRVASTNNFEELQRAACTYYRIDFDKANLKNEHGSNYSHDMPVIHEVRGDQNAIIRLVLKPEVELTAKQVRYFLQSRCPLPALVWARIAWASHSEGARTWTCFNLLHQRSILGN